MREKAHHERNLKSARLKQSCWIEYPHTVAAIAAELHNLLLFPPGSNLDHERTLERRSAFFCVQFRLQELPQP